MRAWTSENKTAAPSDPSGACASVDLELRRGGCVGVREDRRARGAPFLAAVGRCPQEFAYFVEPTVVASLRRELTFGERAFRSCQMETENAPRPNRVTEEPAIQTQ